MYKITFGLFVLCPLLASASPAYFPENASRSAIDRNMVVIDGAQMTRACWYDNRQYSEGAPLEVGGELLTCAPRNKLDLNGPLVWMTQKQLAEQNQPKLQIR